MSNNNNIHISQPATIAANSVGAHTLGCLFYIQPFPLNSYLWFDNHFANCLFAVLYLLIYETLFGIFVNDERDELKAFINSVNAILFIDIVYELPIKVANCSSTDWPKWPKDEGKCTQLI